MKTAHLFIFFVIPILKLTSASLIPVKKISRYLQKDIAIYANSTNMKNEGYNNCNFLLNGENLVIKTFIKNNAIIIDAGANKGGWTKSVLDATKFQGAIYAFEPIPDTYKELKKIQNDTVFCFNLALGKKETTLKMNYFFVSGAGLSTLFNRPILYNRPVKQITVPVISLDKFAHRQGITHIDFLKIDTEGSELDILIGAKNLIERNSIDIIQFEYGGTYPDAHITLLQVYNYLTSNNYLIFRIISDGLIYIPEWNEVLENFLYSNYLAIKKHD